MSVKIPMWCMWSWSWSELHTVHVHHLPALVSQAVLRLGQTGRKSQLPVPYLRWPGGSQCSGRKSDDIHIGGDVIEEVEEFCYLGDLLDREGGVE